MTTEIMLLGFIGFVGYQLKSSVYYIYSYFKNKYMCTLVFLRDVTTGFDAVHSFISTQTLQNKNVELRGGIDFDSIKFAPGFTWFWFNGRPIFVYYTRDLSNKERIVESITLNVLFSPDGYLQNLIKAISVYSINMSEKLTLYKAIRNRFVMGYVDNRKLNTVFSPHIDFLVNDIDKFLHSKHTYTDKGIPYRRGYLLYGQPGMGKTSIVKGLATHFNMPIITLDLSLNSSDVFNLFEQELRYSSPDTQGFNKNKPFIILIEDVDCFNVNRVTNKGEEGINLASLLNFLDGMNSPSNCLMFMTTNNKQQLDPALLRPGRVDVTLEFSYVTKDVILGMSKLYEVVLSEEEITTILNEKRSTSNLQEYLLTKGA